MKFWRIGNRTDDLVLYACAPNQMTAVAKVEALIGPIAPQQQVVHEITYDEIPDGETVFGIREYTFLPEVKGDAEDENAG